MRSLLSSFSNWNAIKPFRALIQRVAQWFLMWRSFQVAPTTTEPSSFSSIRFVSCVRIYFSHLNSLNFAPARTIGLRCDRWRLLYVVSPQREEWTTKNRRRAIKFYRLFIDNVNSFLLYFWFVFFFLFRRRFLSHRPFVASMICSHRSCSVTSAYLFRFIRSRPFIHSLILN